MSVLQSLFAAVDQAFDQVQKMHPDAVRCGKGCDDCCHAVFDVSLIEAVNLFRFFNTLPVEERKAIVEASDNALGQWREITDGGNDPALARIRCPLLADNGECRCYEARPVNCRTYGIPTEIHGKGHVCGLSGFAPGVSYPTVNLLQIQEALYRFSVDLAGVERAQKRWPLAAVLTGEAAIADLLEKIA